jgi:hypothetical protein
MRPDPALTGARRLLILLACGLFLSLAAGIALGAIAAPLGPPRGFNAGIACPLRTLTGIACPACGATRAAGALLGADPAAALAWNPFFVLAIGAVFAGGAASAIAPRPAERGLAAAGTFSRTRRGRILFALGLIAAALWQTARLPR